MPMAMRDEEKEKADKIRKQQEILRSQLEE